MRRFTMDQLISVSKEYVEESGCDEDGLLEGFDNGLCLTPAAAEAVLTDFLLYLENM